MNKKLPLVLIAVLVLVGIVGFVFWQKSTSSSSTPSPASSDVPTIKKVDLSTQPLWVQKLVVTATKGKSANGLDNVTVKVTGIPKDMVKSLTYVITYDTSNKGTQGAEATRPIDISGATVFSKTIDLGTCSTHSCVRHDGVTSVDLELDFTTSSGDQPVWTGTLPIK